jgi:hypothetical protein
MRAIRGLIIDDQNRNVEAMIDRLDPHFEKFGWTVNWLQEEKTGTARQLIRTSEPFDIVVVDLLWYRTDLPEENEARGLELITEVRNRSEHTFILAVTVGDVHRRDLIDNARSRGAHHATYRGQFSDDSDEHSPKAICAAIRAFLLNNGAVAESEVMSDDNDPAVQSLLYEVGEHTIAQLYGAILAANQHRATTINVSSLTPGASGAFVCAVTANVNGVGPLRHVLKMSRTEGALRQEARNAALAGSLIESRFFVRHSPEFPVGGVNGWYALGARLENNASTLRAWLAEGPPSDTVGKLFEALFLDGLRPMYLDRVEEVRECAVSLFPISPHRKREILHAMDGLSGALGHPEGGGLVGTTQLMTDLSLFVREARLGNLARHQVPTKSYTTFSHGDMHGGNILVYRGRHPAPTMIDASDFGRMHWAKDPAKLAVDLLMRSFDGGTESLFFTRFGVWRELATQIGDLPQSLDVSCPTPASRAALDALNWLVTHLGEFCGPLSTEARLARQHWEWRLALINWLLRTIYYADVSTPKKVLAMVAAHDQLTAAVHMLQTNAKRSEP